MNFPLSLFRILGRGAAPFGALLLVSVALAQDTPTAEDLKSPVDQAVATRQATQQQKNDWAEEKAELVQRFRTAQANVQWLAERKAAETARAESLEEVVSELERRLDEADRLESSIQDTLMSLLGQLDLLVGRGIPFLAAERGQRVALVEAELVRPDVDPAEKLRRLLEALQIEAGYASSIEVYQDEITVDGQKMFADILRLGSLDLFWRTPDGSQVGRFDRATGQWVDLPGGDKRSVGLAMEMATRMRPFEVIELPLGKVAP